jgi:transaldolase
MNLLEQLKTQTKVVADTGDFGSIRSFSPVDATTNPSLILASANEQKNASLIEGAVSYAKQQSSKQKTQVVLALDKLIVDFGFEILKIIPGRISTETDARLSFDTNGIIKKAQELISMYEAVKVDRKRVLIKIASTWEGIKAAEQLTKEGIHCNLTLLFSLPQAIACAEAGVQLISPFVGRILDWHLKNSDDKSYVSSMEPGVLLVKNIFNYYKKFGYSTEIMAASFRNIGEITELSGCDLMTISPKLLAELEKCEGLLGRKLFSENAKEFVVEKIEMDEKKFRWMLNEDAMATEKLAEGIRKFTEDIVTLENLLLKNLQQC